MKKTTATAIVELIVGSETVGQVKQFERFQ
jgi:hypothetical protein